MIRRKEGRDFNMSMKSRSINKALARMKAIVLLSMGAVPALAVESAAADGAGAAVTAAFPASDQPSEWARDIVSRAISLGLVPQTLQSQYLQDTTRAEFCALATALYEKITGKLITGRVTFTDTQDVNVAKMASLGVVLGVGGNRFDPYQKLTREQAATMMARLAGAMGRPLPKVKTSFADSADISSWALESVGQMQQSGIMIGTGQNRFSPKDPYTREQSVITMLRLYDISPAQTLLVTSNNVVVRSGSNTGSSSLGKVYVGNTFLMLSKTLENSFYKICFNASVAYIHSSYTQPLAAGAKGIGKFLKVRTTTLNVRAQPDPNAAKVGTLASGSVVELAELKTHKHTAGGVINVFFKIVYNGTHAYVHNRYADIIEPLLQAPDFSKHSAYVRNNAGAVNVRVGPGTAYAILGLSSVGDVFPHIGEADGFYQIEYNGGTAYMSKSYMELISPTAKPNVTGTWVAAVKKSNQTVSVYQSGVLMWFTSCSSGKAGASETPVGTYKIDYSADFFTAGTRDELTCYDALRIYKDYLFHRVPRNEDGTYTGFVENLGKKASSGCVRLPENTSRWMFANFPVGGVVVIS